MNAPRIVTITEQDAYRLEILVSLYADVERSATASLQQELDRAVVVAPSMVSASIVTMNSRVVCRDARGTLRELELVYPREADASAGRVSVLAPVGWALLGAAVGDRVEVVGRGSRATWSIEALRYQPEAAGDFHR